jgi:hypothetical protein
LKNQEKTTGKLADEITVEQQPQELNTTLQFQSDLIHLLNSLSVLERSPKPPPRQEPVTKSGHETRV